MKTYLTEFIGTFFLVLTIGLAVLSGTDMAPIAIGGVLMVMIYMGGHISGAHYNPAVTLAVFIRGKCAAKDIVPYIIAQVVGAFAASCVVYVIHGKTFAGPAPGAGVSAGTAVLAEVLFTFALALVILNVATSKRTEGNSFYGLAIGFTVLAGAFSVGGISGGAFNPAVGIGPILAHVMFGEGGTLGNLWIYIVGPCVGAVIAAIVFKIQEAD